MTSIMPGNDRTASAVARTSASMSRPGSGRTWMVISRATSDCHSTAAAHTNMTAPVVSETRNVMMATTATSACPEMEFFGTSGVVCRGIGASRRARNSPPSSAWIVMMASVVHVQPAFVQHEAARIVLVHQRNVVGCDHDRRAGFVQLDEQPQQALRQIRVDIAGRLVGKQELRLGDDRARDGRTLLLAARQNGRQ